MLFLSFILDVELITQVKPKVLISIEIIWCLWEDSCKYNKWILFSNKYILNISVLFIICDLNESIIQVMVNDIPSLTNGSAITMLCFLLLLYSPSAILFNTCLSYIFDKMDSAQSIMPNITTWVGVIPFILVAVLDTFKWGEYFIISTNNLIIDSELLLLIF